jgi:N-acetylglutamate synthase-like GNAT family acetyltransferase
VIRAIENFLCFGLFDGSKQIGFARTITDYTRFAYILDVFVLEYQGYELGKWLMECVMAYLESFGLFKIMLNTNDAQEFYQRFGFKEVKKPMNCMEALFTMP